jgi:hypothetical protein
MPSDTEVRNDTGRAGERVNVVLRASSLRPDRAGPIRGTIVGRRFGGDHVLLRVAVDDAPVLHVEARWSELPWVGQDVTLAVEPGGLHVIVVGVG